MTITPEQVERNFARMTENQWERWIGSLPDEQARLAGEYAIALLTPVPIPPLLERFAELSR